MNPHIQRLIVRGSFLRRQMWKQGSDVNSKREALMYATMRVAAITWTGLKENRIINRAAALSFSSLLGLGPIIALMVLVSGFVLDQTQPDMAQKTIENVIHFVAPQIANKTEGQDNIELGEMISRFIEASQSGAVGIGGTVMLIFIVIQLFTTIEDAFNDIWGVTKGRNLVTRVVMYWTTISLGTLLVFAGIAVVISETVELSKVINSIPSNGVSEWLTLYGTKLISFAIATIVLSLFYRFIPNTQVDWKASLIGALFAVACFIGLNYTAFLYVERVAMQRTLYGSLGILPALMIGFYFTWLFLLLGGRVSFAVQNAKFKSGKIAWDELSQSAQESLCLLLFTQVCRQFRSCESPLSSVQLAASHGLPRQLASAAMNQLFEIGLVSALPPKDNTPFDSFRYQPAKPLDQIRLIDFKLAFESQGHTPDEDLFDKYDPVVAKYHAILNEARGACFHEMTIDSVIDEMEQTNPLKKTNFELNTESRPVV